MMLEQFLHEELEIAFNFGIPKPEMPESITQNLNPTFELRPYQEDAFVSFIHYFNNDIPGKEKPLQIGGKSNSYRKSVPNFIVKS